MSILGEARFQIALTRAKAVRLADNLCHFVARHLPHRLVCWVLAHVAAATIRDNEVVPEVPYMELNRRWSHRELGGKAAERHKSKTRQEA